MVSTYRIDDEILRGQLDEVLEERRHEVATLDGAARRVLVRRTGRAAAGAVGIGGGLLFLGIAVTSALLGRPTHFWAIGEGDTDGLLVTLLLGAWMAMGSAWALGRLAGHALLDRALGAPPRLSGRPREDLARVERARSRGADVLRLLDRVHAPSLGWPLAAMGLLLPLTLHLAAWVLWTGGGALEHLKDFDGWIRMSAVYVGLAHLVAAVCGVIMGNHLGGRLAAPEAGAFGRGCVAVCLATLAACVPGIILIGIPPLLTALTGGVFIPLAFHLAGRRLAAERAELAAMRIGPRA